MPFLKTQAMSHKLDLQEIPLTNIGIRIEHGMDSDLDPTKPSRISFQYLPSCMLLDIPNVLAE
jgi:hypothetical protein